MHSNHASLEYLEASHSTSKILLPLWNSFAVTSDLATQIQRKSYQRSHLSLGSMNDPPSYVF
jgi:hypothetical protein